MSDEWVMVPVEPTAEMMLAADAAYEPAYTGTPCAAPHDVWRAMLDAARAAQGDKP